jgi:hypothetical protein
MISYQYHSRTTDDLVPPKRELKSSHGSLEAEELVDALAYYKRQAEIYPMLFPNLPETSASGIIDTDFATISNESAATTFFREIRDSAEIIETAPRKGMSLREALEVEEEIYKRLKEEIEEGRRAEARYWQFLDED